MELHEALQLSDWDQDKAEAIVKCLRLLGEKGKDGIRDLFVCLFLLGF